MAPPPVAATGRDFWLPRETELIEAAVPKHSTLASLLRDHGLPTGQITAIIDSTASVFDLRRFKAGQPYKLVRSLDGFLREFEYQIDTDRFLRIAAAPAQFFSPTLNAADSATTDLSTRPAVETRGIESGGLKVEVLPYQKTRRVFALSGEINADRTSLIAAIEHSGEKTELALALAEVFGGEVDFNSDLQRGDRFTLLYEAYERDNQFANYGSILAAEMTNDGRQLKAIRFAVPGGKGAYYDGEGRSLRRFFLRSPLRFEPQVTSGFSRRRVHPVLRVPRAHLGVDYRAAAGSPVIAVANGVVVSAGWAGAAGRMVRIKHPSGYETSYLHLSAISVRNGERVSQGDLIGRVGSSGLATGAHLDYRVRRNGVYVNPLTEHRRLPPGEPIPDALLGSFGTERDRLLAQLSDQRLSSATARVEITEPPVQAKAPLPAALASTVIPH